MLNALVMDFEARVTDPNRLGKPLTDLLAILQHRPADAATALRLARAWLPLWQRLGSQPEPLSAEAFDFTGFSTEAKAELAAAAAAGLVRGSVPEVGGAKPVPGTGWREQFIGGSAEAEAKHYARLAAQARELQDLTTTDGRPRRAFHAKGVGLKSRFTVATHLAPELRVGLWEPGRTWDAVVRLSNAASPDDDEPNLHGLALRIYADSKQDFLATSAPVSHVADAAGQMDVGVALAHGTLKGAFKLLFSRGIGFTLKVLGTLSKQTKVRATSLAELSYFSRAPFRFGAIAARFAFRPLDLKPNPGAYSGPHRLTADLTDRLKGGPLRWEMFIQRFVSEADTPIEQGDADWPLAVAPAEPIGILDILQQDLDAAEPEALAREVENWAFSPFNTRHHTPLGRLNRGRAAAYQASVIHRGSSIDR